MASFYTALPRNRWLCGNSCILEKPQRKTWMHYCTHVQPTCHNLFSHAVGSRAQGGQHTWIFTSHPHGKIILWPGKLREAVKERSPGSGDRLALVAWLPGWPLSSGGNLCILARVLFVVPCSLLLWADASSHEWLLP
jgi:hypothetical protein